MTSELCRVVGRVHVWFTACHLGSSLSVTAEHCKYFGRQGQGRVGVGNTEVVCSLPFAAAAVLV